MELHQLKIFVTVAEEKHLTRAAERLFSSQPAVSAQIKALEEQLGVKLFNRNPKGMQLTPAGERLLEQAHTTLDAAAKLMTQAKSLNGSIIGELKVGINSDLDFLKLPDIAALLSQDHPNLRLSLTHSMSSEIIPAVRKGTMDSGFFFGPCLLEGLHCVALADIETAVVAPATWKERITSNSIEDLASLPWIYTTPNCPFYLLKETLFADGKSPGDKAIFVDTEESIRQFIKAGSGLSLLRRDDADKAEREGWGVRWHGKTPSCPLGLAVLAKRLHEPAIEHWIRSVSRAWRSQEGTHLKVV